MEKVDLRKEFKYLYNPSAKEPEIVEVPDMKFLMVDGAGDPNNSQTFQDAVDVLYSVSYTLKFMMKKAGKADWTVMPLEGLWWMDDPAGFSMENKDAWKWTLMIMQPQFITEDLVREAIEQVSKKKDLPALLKLRFETLKGGPAAQIMHIGPYEAEPPTIEKLHKFVEESGHKLREKHHEIYLGDPRRTAPEKLKTVLRHPIE